MIDQRKRNSQIDLAIGNRIRAIRISSGRSVEVVAASADMLIGDYAEGENGQRRFNAVELHAISQALGISLSDIVSGLEY